MKKLWIILAAALLLAGCGGPKTFETMSDNYLQPQQAEPANVNVELPGEAAVVAMTEDRSGGVYLCDGFTVELQVLDAGDLDATLRTATGFSKERLKLLERSSNGIKCYECAWAAAGEGADQVARTAVLDDGSYHYVLTVMADAREAGRLRSSWEDLFSSFRLNTET